MEQDNRKRPGEHTPKERPRTPASRPKEPRPRRGNAVDREAARRERLAAASEDRAEARSGAARRRPERQTPERSPEKSERAHRKLREDPARQETPHPEQSPAPKRKKKKPHRVYNTNFGFKFAVMLAVVAAIVLSMMIFFKIKHVEVLVDTFKTDIAIISYVELSLTAAFGAYHNNTGSSAATILRCLGSIFQNGETLNIQGIDA